MSAAQCDDYLLSNLSEISNPEPDTNKNVAEMFGLKDHPSVPNMIKPAQITGIREPQSLR